MGLGKNVREKWSECIDNSFKMCCYKSERRCVIVDGGVKGCLYAEMRIMQWRIEIDVAGRGGE